jgi:hypothetical protein
MASAAVPVGLAAIGQGLRKMMSSRNKARSFKDTLSQNPHLGKFDSKTTQRYYNTLWNVNPTMAKDPTVAGAFLHGQHQMNDPSMPHSGIVAGAREMASIRKDLLRRADRREPSQFVHEVAKPIQKKITGYPDAEAERKRRYAEASAIPSAGYSFAKRSSLRQLLGI